MWCLTCLLKTPIINYYKTTQDWHYLNSLLVPFSISFIPWLTGAPFLISVGSKIHLGKWTKFATFHLSWAFLEPFSVINSGSTSLIVLNTVYSFNILQVLYNRIRKNCCVPTISLYPFALRLVFFWHQMNTELVTGALFTVKPASLSSVQCSVLKLVWVKSNSNLK